MSEPRMSYQLRRLFFVEQNGKGGKDNGCGLAQELFRSSMEITDNKKTTKILYLGRDLNHEHAEYILGSLSPF
jgi:hypothetical protein